MTTNFMEMTVSSLVLLLVLTLSDGIVFKSKGAKTGNMTVFVLTELLEV